MQDDRAARLESKADYMESGPIPKKTTSIVGAPPIPKKTSLTVGTSSRKLPSDKMLPAKLHISAARLESKVDYMESGPFPKKTSLAV